MTNKIEKLRKEFIKDLQDIFGLKLSDLQKRFIKNVIDSAYMKGRVDVMEEELKRLEK